MDWGPYEVELRLKTECECGRPHFTVFKWEANIVAKTPQIG
jgi:hypothetical protein